MAREMSAAPGEPVDEAEVGEHVARDPCQTIILAMLTLTLSQTKDRLSAVIDDVERRQERVAITRNGRPAAYLVSAEQMRELEETAFWLSYPGITESVAASRDGTGRGQTYSTDEVARWVADGMPDDEAR